MRTVAVIAAGIGRGGTRHFFLKRQLIAEAVVGRSRAAAVFDQNIATAEA